MEQNIFKNQFIKPENISCFKKGSYYVVIKEDEAMTDIDGTIVFSIDKPGEYELVIDIEGSTYKHPYGGLARFAFPITITE